MLLKNVCCDTEITSLKEWLTKNISVKKLDVDITFHSSNSTCESCRLTKISKFSLQNIEKQTLPQESTAQ